jgi:hypothetical protein
MMWTELPGETMKSNFHSTVWVRSEALRFRLNPAGVTGNELPGA